ncbi:MAG: HIT domain-containing protein [Candidatus Woesearchaeota archaeon]
MAQMTPEEMAAQKEQCIFCQIIAGKRPAFKVYEDELLVAMLDISPAANGHVLLMPKEHYPIMPVVPEPVLAHLFKTAKGVSQALLKAMLVSGTNIFVANNPAAGQKIPHFLVHIIPREQGDKVDVFNLRKIQVNPELMQELQKALSGNLHLIMRDKLAEQGLLEEAQISEEDLLKLIDTNPKLKEFLKANIDKLDMVLESNPQLNMMFKGKDLVKIKAHLQLMPEDKQYKAVGELLKGKKSHRKDVEKEYVEKVEKEAAGLPLPKEPEIIAEPEPKDYEETPEERQLREKLSVENVEPEKLEKATESKAVEPLKTNKKAKRKVKKELDEPVQEEESPPDVQESEQKPIEKESPDNEPEEAADLDAIADLLGGRK